MELPLYRFFTRLRQDLGIELDAKQYFLLLRVWLGGQPEVKTGGDLLALCKILWMTNEQFKWQFEQLFYEEIAIDCQDVFPTIDPAQDGSKKATEDIRNDRKSNYSDESNKGTKRESGATTHPPPTKDPPLASQQSQTSETIESTIFVQFSQGQGSIGADGSDPSGGKPKELDNNYIFSDKYLPIKTRKLQQNWKYLHVETEKTPGSAIDVPGCIQHLGQNGVLTELKYLFEQVNSQKILVLIDQSRSMIAFETLAEQIVQSIQESLTKAEVQVLYFHNVPEGNRLYNTKGNKTKAPWQEKKSSNKVPSLTFIISDAGAARGNQNNERIDSTRKILVQIRKSKSAVLWFNPMPRARWLSNSAGYLSYFVQMLEINETGLKSIPEILKRI